MPKLSTLISQKGPVQFPYNWYFHDQHILSIHESCRTTYCSGQPMYTVSSGVRGHFPFPSQRTSASANGRFTRFTRFTQIFFYCSFWYLSTQSCAKCNWRHSIMGQDSWLSGQPTYALPFCYLLNFVHPAQRSHYTYVYT